MAEFAVSLATSKAEDLLGKLVDKVSDSCIEAWGQLPPHSLQGVRGEIQYIKEELEIMKSFLRSAEEKQERDEVARTWVKQVRELAYDVEDCIDEFVLHLGHRPSSSYRHSLLHRAHSLRSLGARHRIAAEIQNIKSRVQDASNRRLRYGLSSTAQGSVSSTFSITSPGTSQNDPRQLAALFVDETQLVGLDKPRDMLIEWLVEEDEPQLSVISVVGTGGLGKTTLVRKVYESPQVAGGHFKCHAWITVSQSVHIDGLLRDMIEQLMPTPPTGIDKMERRGLIKELRDHLQDKRYVIVFDDIWSTVAWKTLKFALPESQQGSRIMVTTRNEAVANTCCTQEYDHVHRLETLNFPVSWELFCKRVFGGPDHTCPSELEKLSEGIVRKCGGLPLAIVTIGGLLASKPKKMRVEEWRKLLRHLGSELESNPSLEGINQILALSYNDLSYQVKQCFLYLSIFPEDYVIRRRRVQKLWMAEGFLRGHQHGMTAEEIAESCFSELVSRSLVIPVEISGNGNVNSCRVHDIMLEFIVSKSMQENLVSFIRKPSAAMPEDVIRRLSFHPSSSSTDQRVGSIANQENMLSYSSHIRSLIIFKEEEPIGGTLLVSPGMRLLRVLDVSGCIWRGLDPFRHIVKFRHLKYLNVRYSTISVLPKSLAELCNLETLDIRNTVISELPSGIVKLQKLQYLLVGGGESTVYPKGLKMPRGIGSLQALRSLAFFNIDEMCKKDMLLELERLNQLRKLGVGGLTEESDIKIICSILSNLSSCLRSLHLCVNGSNASLIPLGDLSSSPPLLLHSLKLGGYLGNLPSWVGSLDNLAKLLLEETWLGDEAIQVFRTLPNLTHLELLKDSFVGEYLDFSDDAFRSISILRIKYLPNLRSFTYSGKNRFKLLHVSECPALTHVIGLAG